MITMIRFYSMIVPLLLISSFFYTPAQAQEKQTPDSTIALPAEWSTYYVILLQKGPNYNEKRSDDSLRELMNHHIQYQLRLQKTGKAVAAGGFGQATGNIIGMTLLKVDSLKKAKRLAKSDPAVKAGWYEIIVYPWYVPAGRIE